MVRWAGPGQSCDVNGIEDDWGYVKRRVGEYLEGAKGMEELWRRIEEELGYVRD